MTNPADFYLNFRQFSDLKFQARGDSDEAARAVAQQFEGLFVQQMLAAMRSAAQIDAGQHGSQMDFYREMYDRQLALTLAQQDRLGIARMILRQLPGGTEGAAPAQAATSLESPQVVTASPVAGAAARAKEVGDSTAAPLETRSDAVADARRVRLGRIVDDDFAEVTRIERAGHRWESPDNFVADIWPRARRAAATLGVSPELLVAQAALETGWGRHTIRYDDGRNSFNLFGIKAGPDWRGQAVNRASLEYRGGVLQSEVSRFRAYAAPAESLDDYVDFIQSNPRYREALESAGDDRAYIRAIHRAGYATDPAYADKVIGILEGELLQRALAGLGTGVTRYG